VTQFGASSASDDSRALMSIGEVLAHLRTEFPDTTISKLRFLEAEGLIEPRRTASGYRKYSWQDVARLRYILTAQRDHYLPLRVIRQHLEAIDAGRAVPDAPGRPRYPRLLAAVEPTPAPTESSDSEHVSREELRERAGVTEEQLQQMEQYGLLTARPGGFFDAEAVEIATVVAQLGRYGVEPRHLRAHRTAADREIGLFAQVVAPLVRQRGPEARERAAEAVRELATLSLRLHAALLQSGLRGTLGG